MWGRAGYGHKAPPVLPASQPNGTKQAAPIEPEPAAEAPDGVKRIELGRFCAKAVRPVETT